jgi:hypothetical protein
MPLLPSFGVQPSDRDYVAFATWIDKDLEGKVAQARCWWSPNVTASFEFPIATYDHIDFQSAGPAGPFKSKDDLGALRDQPNPLGAWVHFLQSGLNGEALYYAVRDRYRSFVPFRPTAAWNVYTGVWREMRPKGAGVPRPPGPGDGAPLTLDEKIAKYKADYRRGQITDEQLDQLILEAYREFY